MISIYSEWGLNRILILLDIEIRQTIFPKIVRLNTANQAMIRWVFLERVSSAKDNERMKLSLSFAEDRI
jgi:hypothetical protein